ncbi:hypothetical protein QBC35DRAFT_524769 [Podospora australis]|uniref:protein-L-isoaspartate(D-aspartate) O-methyltransferase n=1 Tax=Podospora australis TaxID=1536484 RepID=A0AAN6WQM2_9PEZI|nr:hypothetical protein QBC35DRAFT_524769 [Podospora australis]
MAGRYERVNTRDVEDPETPTTAPGAPRPTYPIPNSPPPSFHSRASSLVDRENRVNADLEDAFGDDDSDDEADDRQRLVRGNPMPNVNDNAAQAASGMTQNSGQASQPQQRPVGAAPTTSRVYGGGIQSDGVFSNLSAKPETGGVEKEELPPSYEQAALDSAPPYWETTILAPGLGGPDDVYIDGLPVGSFFSFLWNGMISAMLEFPGFLLTYLLHSSHAAKNGSRAGLGITLISYGFRIKSTSPISPGAGYGDGATDGYVAPADPNTHDFDPNTVESNDGAYSDLSGGDYAAYILMIVGWFILIRAVSDYLKARQHERLVLQSPDRGLGIPVIATGESPDRQLTLPATAVTILIPSLVNIMAWRSSGATNRDLIENLWRNKMITKPEVKAAFLKVDRAHYAPGNPYKDSPQPIGHAATISAPHMHASAIEHLLPFILPSPSNPAPRVLDIGSGSGYLTHVIAELVGDQGKVVGIEHIAPLKELGEKNMGKSPEGKEFLESEKVRFRVADGRKGWSDPEEEEGRGGKWDAIHVGASAVEVHKELLEQLKSPGRMFIPVDDDGDEFNQHIWCVDKDDKGEITRRKLFGVRYVPLTDPPRV